MVDTLPLYHSDRGLAPFQAEFASYCVARKSNLVNADTGLGKTHIALASAACLIEMGRVDHVIFIVEKNKVDEWAEDIAEFTLLDMCKYTGTTDRRRRLRKNLNQVILATYGTIRADMAILDPVDGRRPMTPGPLLEALRGKNVAFFFDEFSLLGGRTSAIHRSVALAVETIRSEGQCWAAGLTGTPVVSSPENYYNLGRILCPDAVGDVESFHRDHVVDFDLFGSPKTFKNLDLLAQKMSGVLLRKRKTDTDVVRFFPEPIERFIVLPLSPEHADAYSVLTSMVEDLPIAKQRFTFNVLTQFACHPRSILGTQSEFGMEFISEVGADAIARMKSAKSAALISNLHEIIPQGDGVVVFCRLTSVLNEIGVDLSEAGIDYAVYTGETSDTQRREAKARFRSGEVRVLLASSAAERGINLPEATYIINYDVPLTHASYTQRLNRGSRMSATETDAILVVKTLIAEETADAGSLAMWKNRNYQTDVLTNSDADDDDENFVPSSERFRGLNVSRHRRTPQGEKDHGSDAGRARRSRGPQGDVGRRRTLTARPR